MNRLYTFFALSALLCVINPLHASLLSNYNLHIDRSPAAAAPCQAIVGNNAAVVNLTEFAGADWSTAKSSALYMYYINVCGTVLNEMCSSSWPGIEVGQIDTNNTMCYQIASKHNGTGGNSNDCFDGTTPNMWNYPNGDPKQGITCTTKGGSTCLNTTRTTTFNFVCGKDNSTRNMNGTEAPAQCSYNFVFTTCQVCSNKTSCTNSDDSNKIDLF